MSTYIRIALATACFAIVAFPAGAQTAASAPNDVGKPAAAKASEAAASGSAYRSAFDGFRRYADEPVGSWRNANDTVGRVGGWRIYAREAQGTGAADGPSGMQMQPVERAAAKQPAASSPAPAAAPAKRHAGHGSK
ncbi:MAG: hypothetical protein ABIQ33_03450 [Caldimonas sp.]